MVKWVKMLAKPGSLSLIPGHMVEETRLSQIVL